MRIGNGAGSGYDFVRNAANGTLSLQGEQTGFNNIVLAPTSGNVGIGTANPSSTLHVVGTVQLSASSTAITPSIGGALTLGTCDTATTSVDTSFSSSTTQFIGSYQIPEGGLVQPAQVYLTAPGIITGYMCGLGVVTPTSTSILVTIIKH